MQKYGFLDTSPKQHRRLHTDYTKCTEHHGIIQIASAIKSG